MTKTKPNFSTLKVHLGLHLTHQNWDKVEETIVQGNALAQQEKPEEVGVAQAAWSNAVLEQILHYLVLGLWAKPAQSQDPLGFSPWAAWYPLLASNHSSKWLTPKVAKKLKVVGLRSFLGVRPERHGQHNLGEQVAYEEMIEDCLFGWSAVLGPEWIKRCDESTGAWVWSEHFRLQAKTLGMTFTTAALARGMVRLCEGLPSLVFSDLDEAHSQDDAFMVKEFWEGRFGKKGYEQKLAYVRHDTASLVCPKDALRLLEKGCHKSRLSEMNQMRLIRSWIGEDWPAGFVVKTEVQKVSAQKQWIISVLEGGARLSDAESIDLLRQWEPFTHEKGQSTYQGKIIDLLSYALVTERSWYVGGGPRPSAELTQKVNDAIQNLHDVMVKESLWDKVALSKVLNDVHDYLNVTHFVEMFHSKATRSATSESVQEAIQAWVDWGQTKGVLMLMPLIEESLFRSWKVRHLVNEHIKQSVAAPQLVTTSKGPKP